MSVYSLPAVAALIINSALAVYLLYRNPKKVENRLFAFMLLSFAFWDVGEILMRTTSDINVATIGTKMFLTGGFLAAPIFVLFTLFFPKNNKLSSNKFLMGMIVILSTFVMSVHWSTDLLVRTVKPFHWGYSPVYGPFYPVAALLHIGFTMAGLAVMGLTYKKTEISIVRKRAVYVITGTMIAIIFGSPTNVIFPLFGITVIELASAFSVVMGAFIAYAILKHKLMIIPKTEEIRPTEVEYNLKQGTSYLIEEEKPHRSFEIFTDLVTHGAHGLCITRKPREDVREEFGLIKTPIIWLSRTSGHQMCIDPTMTAELSMTIKNFFEESQESVILLDGLEYLIVHNNYMKVLKLMHDLNDAVSINNAVMIVSVDKRTLTEKEYALLTRGVTVLPDGHGLSTARALAMGKTEGKTFML